jgi:predicted DNA-binding transcriptional regulator AlpA
MPTVGISPAHPLERPVITYCIGHMTCGIACGEEVCLHAECGAQTQAPAIRAGGFFMFAALEASMSVENDFQILTSDYYTTRQVCEKAGIGRPALHAIMKADRSFPRPYRFGVQMLLHRAELVDQWLATYRKGRPRPKG